MEDATLFYESTRSIVFYFPNCTGDETRLIGCDHDDNGILHSCDRSSLVSVICQGKYNYYTTMFFLLSLMIIMNHSESSIVADNCNHGDIRLAGGDDSTIGRVEVCINNAWGTVCNSRFGTRDAQVTCRHLNLPTDGNAE